jgi:hypothetical protein
VGILRSGLLLALIACRAWAHSSGASDPGLALELRIAPGAVQLGLDAQTSSSGARSDEDLRFFERVEELSVRPLFAFSPLRRLTVMLQVPVVHKRWAIATEGFPPTRVNSTGLGDAEVAARYLLMDSDSFGALAISAGASLPTGDNSAQQDAVRLDEHAQLGRGSVGPQLSFLYTFERGHWSVAASVAGKAQLENGWGYQYAPMMSWRLAVAYAAAERLSVGLGFDGRFAGNDADGRVVYQHTGGLALMLTTLVRIRLFDQVAVAVAAQTPVFLKLNGDQQLGPVIGFGVHFLLP